MLACRAGPTLMVPNLEKTMAKLVEHCLLVRHLWMLPIPILLIILPQCTEQQPQATAGVAQCNRFNHY